MSNIGAIRPVAELSARYIAAVFHGDIPRPKEETIESETQAFRKHRHAGSHNKSDVTTKIMEMIGAELGVTPTIFQALRNPSKLLFGPMFPRFYRSNPKVDGAEAAAKANERLARLEKNPPAYHREM